MVLRTIRTALIALALAALQTFASEYTWNNSFNEELNTAIKIPYFYEVIAKHLLDGDIKFVANPDSVGFYLRRSHIANTHDYATENDSLPTSPELQKVYTYLNSEAWDNDLNKLTPEEAAFVRIVVYTCFFDRRFKDYSRKIHRRQIVDKKKHEQANKLLGTNLRLHRLRRDYLYFLLGFGADAFSNGADEKVGPGPTIGFGIGYCISMLCAEARISMIFMDPYKENVVQSGITYPKEDINVTPVELLFKGKLFSSFDYDFAVFGGLRMQAFEFDSDLGEEYEEKYGKDMANGYSYGATTGIMGTKHFAEELMDISFRIGVASVKETSLDIHGLNWYATIDFSLNYEP